MFHLFLKESIESLRMMYGNLQSMSHILLVIQKLFILLIWWVN